MRKTSLPQKKTTESQQTILKIDGSSTVYPITEAVAEDFKTTNPTCR
jgi:ABC-type phosphate transport system substrate-binding protein